MDATMRVQYAFGALVLAQALHSTEEVIGRLWETFPPARFVSSLVSNDLASAFLFLNVCIFVFGALCYFGPVRRHWAIATPILWLWIVVEMINGIGHPLWCVLQRGYVAGVITAPILLVLALYLARNLRQSAAMR
ncbi:MAG TPA: HXXEE domain-containing protein [Steroidobacteraceae bacterium]|nr:HXXEE domain-containing protein [Steroidobacteraceae bacterium]